MAIAAKIRVQRRQGALVRPPDVHEPIGLGAIQALSDMGHQFIAADPIARNAHFAEPNHDRLMREIMVLSVQRVLNNLPHQLMYGRVGEVRLRGIVDDIHPAALRREMPEWFLAQWQTPNAPAALAASCLYPAAVSPQYKF